MFVCLFVFLEEGFPREGVESESENSSSANARGGVRIEYKQLLTE